MNPSSRLIVIILLSFVLCTFSPVSANLSRGENSAPSLAVSPASIVIKVGDSTNVTITLTNSSNFGRVCFGVENFPTSGFIITIVPLCALTSPAVAILTVVATPAAAPQSFTASVAATIGNRTISTPIDVTVVPAMSAWIPWSIVMVFILILVIPMFVKWKPHRR